MHCTHREYIEYYKVYSISESCWFLFNRPLLLMLTQSKTISIDSFMTKFFDRSLVSSSTQVFHKHDHYDHCNAYKCVSMLPYNVFRVPTLLCYHSRSLKEVVKVIYLCSSAITFKIMKQDLSKLWTSFDF